MIKKKVLKLNGIVHPAVRKRMFEKKEVAIKQCEAIIIMDIPLFLKVN